MRVRPAAILALNFFVLAAQPCLKAAEPHGFLHTQGQDIVDEAGQKVLLRGVGLGNWMLPEGYMWRFGPQGDRPRKIEKLVSEMIGPENATKFWTEYRQQYITESDIKRIAELGFNSVRPALNARLFLTEGSKPVFIDEGFTLLDNLVGWCKAHGLYVILDLHAAPGGQTGANIDDSLFNKPDLFTTKENQDRLVELWVKLAGRYKDSPTVAAYDLLNEPLPAGTQALARHKSQLEPLYKRVTQAIRQIDKKHIITLEGADWANDWSVFSTPFDDNLVYQFHYYCWDKPARLKTIGDFLRHRRRLNAPAWVGETGEKDNTIYWGTTDYFESVDLGWSFWPWKKLDTHNTPYSIKPPQGWEEIAAYSNGQAKPSAEAAQKALDQLLQNIRLENCIYFPDVVSALFHRVPGKVEAENYGHEGLNKSFSVAGGENAPASKFYRTLEPVRIEPVEGTGSEWLAGQAIKLKAKEWTAYTFNSLEARDYRVIIRVKADQAPATIQISINDQPQELTASTSTWSEAELKPMALIKGSNRLKLLVQQGAVSVDWLAFQ